MIVNQSARHGALTARLRTGADISLRKAADTLPAFPLTFRLRTTGLVARSPLAGAALAGLVYITEIIGLGPFGPLLAAAAPV